MIPVVFANQSGKNLFGMLHVPPRDRKDTAIIILSPGIKNRVAPHRLYVKMARRFCELGFHVLRFDPEGLGDSEGEIDERFTANLYGSIQVGRFIEDTACAMDWMEKEYGISRCILAGLCGGAITGLLTGARDRRVVALLGLGIPVILDSADIDPSRYITAGELMGLREKYKKKFLNPNAWFRFMTFRSDYRMLFKSFLVSGSKTASDNKPAIACSKIDKKNQIQAIDNFNVLFPAALNGMLSGNRPILFIFSESDRLFWEYEEKFVRRYPEKEQGERSLLTVKVTKDANHIFSFSEWQKDMIQESVSWLATYSREIDINRGTEQVIMEFGTNNSESAPK